MYVVCSKSHSLSSKVLEKNEPSLLAENGGDVELTATWAKSFLKRVRTRIRKKSKDDDAAQTC